MSVPHFRIGIVALCALLLAACGFEERATGPLRDEPISIGADNVERANVELDMGAGEMTLRGGASKILEGRFEYNVDAWKPRVKSSINGSDATITIRQPEHANMHGHQRYLWDLQFNDRPLLDLALNCGAGKAQLDLGSLHLRHVEVHIGAGKVDLDLRGKPTRDYDVKITGGVGEVTVQLPQDTGIWAEAHGGLGKIDVSGLDKHGDHWENDLYEKAKVNVHLEVTGGIGKIRIMS
jgi:N-terminal domain of toast_rack, DUF2154